MLHVVLLFGWTQQIWAVCLVLVLVLLSSPRQLTEDVFLCTALPCQGFSAATQLLISEEGLPAVVIYSSSSDLTVNTSSSVPAATN